jgi:hypothetical protein
VTDNHNRFVAIAKSEGSSDDTYVLEGSMTLAEVFKFINDRRIIHKVESLQIHLDQAIQKPWTERYSRNHNELVDPPAS